MNSITANNRGGGDTEKTPQKAMNLIPIKQAGCAEAYLRFGAAFLQPKAMPVLRMPHPWGSKNRRQMRRFRAMRVQSITRAESDARKSEYRFFVSSLIFRAPGFNLHLC